MPRVKLARRHAFSLMGFYWSPPRNPGTFRLVMKPPKSPAVVLLTGAAGFLGKVVLEELIRRKQELQVEKIILILRSKRGKTARERFDSSITRSECFKLHDERWVGMVEVLSGDLGQDHFGTSVGECERLAKEVTHIIHCAASIDFNLPVRLAAQANISSALSVLEFAKTCRHLERMVAVSTAYVNPHREGEIGETLATLPVPAKKLYRDILEKKIGEKDVLGMLGHPNTYTLTKCLAEHLLTAERGTVPLSIVRPSIISVAEKFPLPGWIDSNAALAGFISGSALGYVRLISGDPEARADIVPVDRVSHKIVNEAFYPDLTREAPIIHAVSGLKNALRVGLIEETMTNYFKRHPQERPIRVSKVAPYSFKLELEHRFYHQAPLFLARLGARLTGKKQLSKRMKKMSQRMETLFRLFPYFTHHTFDFKLPDPDFSLDQKAYAELISEGTHRFLLRNQFQK